MRPIIYEQKSRYKNPRGASRFTIDRIPIMRRIIWWCMHAYGDTHIAHNKFSYTPQQQCGEGLDMKADRPTGGFVVWRFHPSCVTFSQHRAYTHTKIQLLGCARARFSRRTAYVIYVPFGFILHQSTESPPLIGLSPAFCIFFDSAPPDIKL